MGNLHPSHLVLRQVWVTEEKNVLHWHQQFTDLIPQQI